MIATQARYKDFIVDRRSMAILKSDGIATPCHKFGTFPSFDLANLPAHERTPFPAIVDSLGIRVDVLSSCLIRHGKARHVPCTNIIDLLPAC